MDCPVPWPEFPVYPVDPTNAQSGPATSSQVPLDVFPGFASTQPKSSPHKSSSDSLRGLVLKCLYSSDDGSLAMDRISRFITRVRRRNFDLLALQGVSEPTKELEDKFRSIMKALETLEQSAQTRQVLEALADNTILDNEECIKVQQAYSAWISNRESQKIKQTVREWVNNLELLACVTCSF